MVEILILVLIVLQLLDIYSTYNILKLGGKELNPLLAKLFELIGVMPGLVLAKTIFIGILLYFYITKQETIQVLITPLILISIVYAYIVQNNFKVLKTLKARPTNQPT